ncbi:MAG: RnfABCDGE type electron transport complex subunit B [Steroidobacteraceae bacterium]
MAADPNGLASRIDALLPQTQCRRCGFDGCRPYAEALARGETSLNRCPPGGQELIERLAALVGGPALPLDPACGAEGPPLVAWIDEPACIGCARCLEVCPTDAIVGARKRMHTVIADDCSGCELCLPACPVDCIRILAAPGLPAEPLPRPAIEARAARFRRRHDARRSRLERDASALQAALRASLADDDPQAR